jgi:hypothetical protein
MAYAHDLIGMHFHELFDLACEFQYEIGRVRTVLFDEKDLQFHFFWIVAVVVVNSL